jgi:hypothetical protein
MDIIHKIQHRFPEGEDGRYTIIKYYYDNPLSIKVEVNGVKIDTFPFNNPENLLDHTTTCGAHNYFFDNSTIHFLVTNKPDCQVRVY